MKRIAMVFVPFLVVGLVLVALVMSLPNPAAAQDSTPPRVEEASRPAVAAPAAAQPEWGGSWAYGTPPPFSFTRFDGEYYPSNGLVYFLGGRNVDATDGSVWVWNPATDVYTDTGTDLVTPISNYTMNLLQDALGWGFYVFCGRPAAGGVVGAVQVYYPDTNTVVQLPAADDFPGTGTCTSGLNVVYDNKVYVAGGLDTAVSPYNFSETWVFDPMAASGSRWTQIVTAPLGMARAYIMGAVVNDLIYAIGGSYYDGSGLVNTQIVEVLDPNAATPVWDDAAAADLPVGCSESRAWGFNADDTYIDPDGTQLAGKIVSACGFWSAQVPDVYVYDTTFDYWESFPFLQTARRSEAAILLPNETGNPSLWVWGGYGGESTVEYYDLNYLSTSCNVLLVDDDWDQYSGEPYNGTGTAYYTETLEFLGYNYDRWDVWTMGDPSLTDLQPYDAVVWFLGYAWSETITGTNETDLAAYLDSGGNLFLTGADYLYDAGLTPFGQNYLGISTYIEDVSDIDVIGIAGDPVGDGLGPYDLAVPTSWPSGGSLYPDYATAATGGSEPFRFNTSGESNSTDLEGAFKTVFLAWPFEGLADLGDRAEVMGSILNWFCVTSPVDFNLMPPVQSGSGLLGETVQYTLTIANGLGADETFDLTYDSAWPINGPITVSVPHGSMADFVVDVTIPVAGNCYDVDTAIVEAIAQSNPLITDTAQIETSVDPSGSGVLEGYVYATNTGLPVESALVTVGIGEEDWLIDYSGSDGYFTVPNLYACTYEGEVYGFGYSDETGLAISIEDGLTTTVEIYLDASLPVLTGAPVSVNVPVDSSTTYTLALANDGSADLTFHISELPDDAIYPLMTVDSSMPRGVDPQVYNTLAASPDGEATFIVYMAQQADLSAAYHISDWSARGQYVLDALRATSDNTQADLRADLDLAKVSYESHYLVNALVVTGNLQVVNTLASRTDVAYIGANTAILAPAPVEIMPGPTAPDVLEWNIERINADQVWSTYDVTGEGIVIANIDTGVQWDHPALINQYRGWDGTAEDHNHNWWDPYDQSPLVPNDVHAHGTHTMGTMVGSDNPTEPLSATNGIGVAPGATWLACDGFDDNTGYGYNAELLECAEFMLAPWDLSGANPNPDMRPDIVNNSWGGGQAQWWYEQAIYAWRAAGIMGVFSAGNDGPSCSTAGDPGDSANVIAVGATDNSDVIAVFSSRGPAAVSGILKPNVSAPGSGIRSSVPGDAYEGGWGGTSMAAPHVAGEAALIWAAVPELRGNVQMTYWIIEQSAFGITTNQGCGGDGLTDIPNNVYGWGRVNVLAAVEMAMGANWNISWLEVVPMSGVVAISETVDIVLNFDTTGLVEGVCYAGTLKVEYNDPDLVEEFIPVELCIVPGSIADWYYYLPIIYKAE